MIITTIAITSRTFLLDLTELVFCFCPPTILVQSKLAGLLRAEGFPSLERFLKTGWVGMGGRLETLFIHHIKKEQYFSIHKTTLAMIRWTIKWESVFVWSSVWVAVSLYGWVAAYGWVFVRKRDDVLRPPPSDVWLILDFLWLTTQNAFWWKEVDENKGRPLAKWRRMNQGDTFFTSGGPSLQASVGPDTSDLLHFAISTMVL